MLEASQLHEFSVCSNLVKKGTHFMMIMIVLDVVSQFNVIQLHTCCKFFRVSYPMMINKSKSKYYFLITIFVCAGGINANIYRNEKHSKFLVQNAHNHLLGCCL